MSVAYLITSYVGAPQVLRLARRLRADSPDATIALHHDERRERVDEGAFARLGVLRVLPPTPVEWGMGSQLAMHLRCYRFLLEQPGWEWLVLLSGQDYPARRLEAVERELLAAPYDAFLPSEPVPRPGWSRAPLDEFASRYHFAYRPVREPGRRGRALAHAARPLVALRTMPSGPVLGVRVPRPPFAQARRGPDWITLSRRAVQALVAAPPRLVRHFERTLIPTESFPHTVLAGMRLSGDARRFTRWEPGAHRPATLTRDDLAAILASGADFARKFDVGVDATVLDALDAAAR